MSNVKIIGDVPEGADYRDNRGDGQQHGYAVLSDDERAKGFVRPYRDSYVHTKCHTVTRMGRAIAETYARDPYFYSGTFCVGCHAHFPLSEFVWDGTSESMSPAASQASNKGK